MTKQFDPALAGNRAALKPGSLSRPFFGPQDDEHRAPPNFAQPNVKSASTIVPATIPHNTASSPIHAAEHDKLDGIEHGFKQP